MKRKMMQTILSALVGGGLLCGGVAMSRADTLGAPPASGKLHAGAQVGVVLPQLQSELGTTVGFDVEAGYQVWKQLSPFVSLGYAQPSTSSELADPRLVGGTYMTSTTQRELTLTAGAIWRAPDVVAKLGLFGGVGARIWMLETLTDGESGGESFAENRETSTRFGAAVMGGGEYRLGPGAAVLELDLGGSDLPHLVTGDVATTSISVSVGYRLLLM